MSMRHCAVKEHRFQKHSSCLNRLALSTKASSQHWRFQIGECCSLTRSATPIMFIHLGVLDGHRIHVNCSGIGEGCITRLLCLEDRPWSWMPREYFSFRAEYCPNRDINYRNRMQHGHGKVIYYSKPGEYAYVSSANKRDTTWTETTSRFMVTSGGGLMSFFFRQVV